MLAKHGAAYLVVKLIPAILSLSALVIFTRILTPAEYGVYSLTILVAGVGNAVLLQWLSLGVGRYLPAAGDKEDENRLLTTAKSISFTVFVVVIVLSLGCAALGGFSKFSIIFWVVGFLFAVQGWHELNLKILNTSLKPFDYGKVLIVKSAVGFFLSVLAAYLGFGVAGILVSIIVGSMMACIISRQIWNGLPWFYIDRGYLGKLFAYGAPLTVTYLLIFIIDASDRFFIERIVGVEAVGVYSASYELSQYSIGMLTSVVHLAALPLVINALAKEGLLAAGLKLRQTFSLVFAVAVPLSAGMALTAPDIAYSILGDKFRVGATVIIPWIALAMFLSTMKSYYFDYAFQLSGSTRMQMGIVFVSAIVNVVFNYFLIAAYGATGAAISTVIAFLVSLILSWILGLHVFAMPRLPYKNAAQVILAVVVMAVIVSSINLELSLFSFFLKVILGGAAYIAVLLVFNARYLIANVPVFLKK